MPGKTSRGVKTKLAPLFDAEGPTEKRCTTSPELLILDGSAGSSRTGDGAPLSALSHRMMTSTGTQTDPETVCMPTEPSSPSLLTPPSSPSSLTKPSSSSLLDLQNLPLESASNRSRTEENPCSSLKHQATQTIEDGPIEKTEEEWGEFSESMPDPSSSTQVPESQPVEGVSPKNWSINQVRDWLRSIELNETYVQQFFEEEVNGAVLQIVNDDFLRNTLSMKSGPALWLIEKRDELFCLWESRASTSPPLADDVDGRKTTFFINTVKVAVLHLFSAAFNKFRFQDCYGSQVNHPNQVQDSCLFPPEESYVHINFFKTLKILFNSRFLDAIQLMLCMRGITSDEARVKSVAEAMMIELKCQDDILGAVNRMHEELVDGDQKTLTLLDHITSYWGCN